jgi:hypothetical protein
MESEICAVAEAVDCRPVKDPVWKPPERGAVVGPRCGLDEEEEEDPVVMAAFTGGRCELRFPTSWNDIIV